MDMQRREGQHRRVAVPESSHRNKSPTWLTAQADVHAVLGGQVARLCGVVAAVDPGQRAVAAHGQKDKAGLVRTCD